MRLDKFNRVEAVVRFVSRAHANQAMLMRMVEVIGQSKRVTLRAVSGFFK